MVLWCHTPIGLHTQTKPKPSSLSSSHVWDPPMGSLTSAEASNYTKSGLTDRSACPMAGKGPPLNRAHIAPARATFPQLKFASLDLWNLLTARWFWLHFTVYRRTHLWISLCQACLSIYQVSCFCKPPTLALITRLPASYLSFTIVRCYCLFPNRVRLPPWTTCREPARPHALLRCLYGSSTCAGSHRFI